MGFFAPVLAAMECVKRREWQIYGVCWNTLLERAAMCLSSAFMQHTPSTESSRRFLQLLGHAHAHETGVLAGAWRLLGAPPRCSQHLRGPRQSGHTCLRAFPHKWCAPSRVEKRCRPMVACCVPFPGRGIFDIARKIWTGGLQHFFPKYKMGGRK